MTPKILNVDDHEAARYARSRLLSRAGFQVLEAGTGEATLRIVREQRPDLILLDINLPDVNGFELCRKIRGEEETQRMPIIFLSASARTDEDVVTGLELGGDNYLREPVDPTILVATIRAVLRARKAEEALVRSNEQLRRFAYVVSHELQEPLRMVKSYTQLITSRYNGKLDPEADEFLGFVVQGATRMELFIRDMLSYSQITEGSIEMKPCSCQNALDWALLELEGMIRESGARITQDPLPTVQCDPMRLAHVFKNIVGNAIKYRGEQDIMIHVSAAEEADMWRISVTDNGMGIDPKYADSIFGLFKRLHGRERPGSGVGLAICKQIIENHGGRIWVEPAESGGSTFYFTLQKPAVEHRAAGR